MILNGGSSAGKTTLGRSLQSALSDTWLLLGIDLLIWMLPPRMINDADGLSVHEGVIVHGGLFMSLYAGFRTAVAALARSGVNVLLDDLTLDGTADQHRWSDALQGLEVLWVGVRCDPAIAAEREPGDKADCRASRVIRQIPYTSVFITTWKSILVSSVCVSQCLESPNQWGSGGRSQFRFCRIAPRGFL